MAVYLFRAQDADVAHEQFQQDFHDHAAMKRAAIAFASRKLPAVGDGIFDSDLRLEVTDNDGLILLTIIVACVDNTLPRQD